MVDEEKNEETKAKNSKDSGATSEEPNKEKLVFTEEELKKQIRTLENQIFIAQKQHSEVNEVLKILKNAIEYFSKDKLTVTEKHVLDVKEKLNEVINHLNLRWKLTYFVSVWGLFPTATAILAIFCSFILMGYKGSTVILGIVPLWAPLMGVIGASIQILVGVVDDYKKDSMISYYKRLWYAVLPVVGFVFGFIAILLIQAGLINITNGQFDINQVNQTITFYTTSNQTITANSTTSPRLEVPIIICFLAGYLTDWFMGLLGKFAGMAPSGTEK